MKSTLTHTYIDHGCLTIYQAKLLGSLFGQMVSKIQDWQIQPWNRIYHLYKSVPFNKKWLQRPKTGVKHGFAEMEYKFLFGTFHWEICDYLFYVSSLLEISAGMVQKVMFYLLSNWISPKLFAKHFFLFYPTLKVKALTCK